MPDGGPMVDGPPPPPSQQLDPEISTIIGNVSSTHITDSLTTLVAFYTRNSCSSQAPGDTHGIGAARTWIQQQFAALGSNVHVALDPYQQTGCAVSTVNENNVIAWIPGTGDPQRVIVIGGHYDSRGNQQTANNGTEAAPGANDSGSQTALVLEAAKVLAGRNSDATLVFAAFAGEEQFLYGSKNFAPEIGAFFASQGITGAQAELMLDCDIVGGDVDVNNATTLHQFRLYSPGTPREVGGTPGASETNISGTTDDTSPSRGVMRYIGYWGLGYVPSMAILPHLREDRPGRGGDHEPFLDYGIAGVRFIETNENFSRQHTAGDDVAHLTPDYLARVTQVVVATAASLARAPRAPQSAMVTGNASNVTVSWQAPAVGSIDHYVVAARPVTENFYHTRVSVTSTSRQLTAADLGVSGAFYISVAAVDAMGHESLFAYPEWRCDSSGCQITPGSTNTNATCNPPACTF